MTRHRPPKQTRIEPTPRDVVRLCRRCLKDDAGCWIFNGYRDRKGYGQFKIGGRAHWAHRVAFAIFRGSIPEGMTINHMCNNPSCCNPQHLELKTVSENTAEGNRRRAQEYPI